MSRGISSPLYPAAGQAAQLLDVAHQYLDDCSQVEQATSTATAYDAALVLDELVHADAPTIIAALMPTNQASAEARAIAGALQQLELFEQQRHALSENRPATDEQAKVIRAMLLSAPGDARAVLIKMANVLVQLRAEPAARAAAAEAQTIYAPLAGQLGISHLESALQDAAFKNLEPDSYAWTQAAIALGDKQRRRYIEIVSNKLRQTLGRIGVRASVSGRVKHAYSFYQKLLAISGAHNLAELQQLGPPAINDVIAFRVLVATKTECYQALDEVHKLWPPRLSRIKDFIAKPKANDYQSLHTTVTCVDGKLVEIQIRTHDMHQHAEYGPAMHWHYKVAGDQASGTAPVVVESMAQASALRGATAGSPATFVFTPKGDVIKLPAKATPLDFAYHIHTSIGDHCAGALIVSADSHYQTRHMVPLGYQLVIGDVVSIVTNPHAHPTRDWLQFAHTKTGRARIMHFIRELILSPTKAKPLPQDIAAQPPESQPQAYAPSGKIAGLQGLLTTFAKCCQPVQGSPIIGLVSRTRGIVIHRQDCFNIRRLSSTEKSRLLETVWQTLTN
ncbi:MAG TPA: TGS domain-containing protein [Candidatus Acidoferrum sp.]|nr:TGS domain-containing protein [Candidatus Acidoferrum sp.]